MATKLKPDSAQAFSILEPSFEVDLKVPDLGKPSNKWIEIMGCGRPHVLGLVEIDPDEWTGLLGLGIERVSMLLHGIDDIGIFIRTIRFSPNSRVRYESKS